MAHEADGNIHGHSWKLEVTFEGDGLDHGRLKKYVGDLAKEFDHRLLLWRNQFNGDRVNELQKQFAGVVVFPDPVTGEGIFKILERSLVKDLPGILDVRIAKIKLWEGNDHYYKTKYE